MMTTAPTSRDPRIYQIAVLSGLLLYGVLGLDFEVEALQAAVIVAAALATQALATRLAGLPRFDPRSAMISALSLCLLLRTGSLALAAIAAAITIGSKFTIRARGGHVFNPTNFGLVAMMLLFDGVWISPGQWGSAAYFGLLVAGLGGLVVHRATRSDVTWAFLVFYSALLFGRAAWLGDPLAIPLHQLGSGAFLIFTFFMISDPKTTPASRPGRIVYALLVALVAGWIRFGLFRPNDLIWALVACAPLVPLVNRLLPGERYRWRTGPSSAAGGQGSDQKSRPKRSWTMRPRLPRPSVTIFLMALLFLPALPARAFCGFYVAKADTELFNQASKVVLVRDGDRTVITMANDYRGDPREFALVVPVPTFLEREQIHVGERAIIEHLDAYSAPRLVEYHDPDPCYRRPFLERMRLGAAKSVNEPAMDAEASKSLGVTVEASYTVGEYDILILSAEESDGLETWLRRSGYRIPEGASRVLASYVKQEMRFFVAKVNLGEQSKLGFSFLRPLQVAFESPKFMLPIRLGTINADGPQDLFVFALTRTGRVETTNYRTVRLPSDVEVPGFVRAEFADFYRDMFRHQVERERMRAVFLEYAWDMGWCDPCAADPLSDRELRELGVFWIDGEPRRDGGGFKSQARDVFITRLHLRYTAETFPEDLFFQETGDRANFQGRYVIRNPWRGDPGECRAAREYFADLRVRQQRRAETLASLTGWPLAEITRRMDLDGDVVPAADDVPWWKKLWSKEEG